MKKIALWGAGNVGNYIINQKDCPFEIKYVIDSDSKKRGQTIKKILIINPDDFLQLNFDEFDGILIALSNMNESTKIFNILRKTYTKRIGFFPHDYIFNSPINWECIIWLKPTFQVLNYLEINLWNGCNFSCAGCTHLAPLFSKDSEGYSPEKLKKDMKRIADFLYIKKIRLLGGEPLLHPQIEECLRIIREIFPLSQLCIVSNGILLPSMKESFFYTCYEKKYELNISLYKPVLTKKNQIELDLKRYGIKYKFTDEINNFYRTFNPKGNSDKDKAHTSCHMKTCYMLKDSKIYKCPMEGFIDDFVEYYQLENITISSDNLGINIYDFEDKRLNYLSDIYQKPIDTCKFCAENGGEFFEWFMTKNPKYTDWVCPYE